MIVALIVTVFCCVEAVLNTANCIDKLQLFRFMHILFYLLRCVAKLVHSAVNSLQNSVQ